MYVGSNTARVRPMAESLRRNRKDWDDDDDDRDEKPSRKRKESERGGGAIGTGVMLLAGLLLVLLGGMAVIGVGIWYFFVRTSTPATTPPPPPVVVNNQPANLAPIGGAGPLDIKPLEWNRNPVEPKVRQPRAMPNPNPGDGFEETVTLPPVGAARTDPANPPPFAENANSLILKHRNNLSVASSRHYGGQWGPAAAFDRDHLTSWYPLADAATGTMGWLSVQFPEAVTVRRVTALGNREPQWPGYTNRQIRFDLFDAKAAVLNSTVVTNAGAKFDADFTFPVPITGVRTLRLTILECQQGSGAVAEFQVD
jgi:hypothetical protein